MVEIKFAIAGEVLSLNFKQNRLFSSFINERRGFLTDKKADFSIYFFDGKEKKDLFTVGISQKKSDKNINIRNWEQLERSFNTKCLEIGMLEPIGLENYLRVFFSHYLFRKGGFLLHASTVGYKNKAFVFTGPSGTGKSTIARISKDKMVLTDDLVAIKRIEDTYYAFATPFGLQNKAAGTAHLPISGIYLISHGQSTTCRKLPLKQALAKVMSNIVLIGADSLDLPVDNLFDNCYNALKDTPCYGLSFNKNEDIWRYLKNAQ